MHDNDAVARTPSPPAPLSHGDFLWSPRAATKGSPRGREGGRQVRDLPDHEVFLLEQNGDICPSVPGFASLSCVAFSRNR